MKVTALGIEWQDMSVYLDVISILILLFYINFFVIFYADDFVINHYIIVG